MKFRKIAIVCAMLAAFPALSAFADDAPETSAKAYIVMEADTGDVLAEKNADDRMLIASTTKIMTALLALERCDLDQSVTVEPGWTGIEGSSMYLAPGQELTVSELLYGLLLASGNDAAQALADIAAGSTEAFAALMNERAASLGCVNTHFENPSGLDGAEHYSSARDLALMTREAIRNEVFCQIVSSASKTVGENTYTNHNRLLNSCEGVFGVKTGYTEAAGRTLVTACERDGVTLICVTLSDPDDWLDHASLYDWAYGRYERTELLSPGERWTVPVIGGEAEQAPVYPAEPLYAMLREGQEASLVIRLPAFAYAAICEGEQAGEAAVLIDGREVSRTALLFDASVERTQPKEQTFFDRVAAIFGHGERNIYTLE